MLTNGFGTLQKQICLVTGKITNSPKANAEKLLQEEFWQRLCKIE